MRIIFLNGFVVCFFLAASLTVGAGDGIFRPVNGAAGTPANTFNLRAFGAVGDGVADDGPALQSALDALADAGGGTLYVPAGRYLIATPAAKEFSNRISIIIRGDEPNPPSWGWGLGLSSEFVIAVGKTANALTLRTLRSLVLKNLLFVGVPGVINDAKVTLSLSQIGKATIQTCEFYGLSSQVGGGSVVYNYGSDLNIDSSAFLGCSASNAVRSSIVHNIWWKGIAVTNTHFIDYGERRGFFSKTPYQAPFAWLGVGNAAALDSTTQRTVVVQNVVFDEGALSGIRVDPEMLRGPSDTITPIALVYISGLYQNISQLGKLSWGNSISNVERLFIENSRYVWSHNAAGAIRLSKIDNAILDLVKCTAPQTTANRIAADSSVKKLTVINSIYAILDSDLETTQIINTDDPADDPAQYVRQRYIDALGHGPNALKHYYWTDQILQCDEDSQCVAEKQLALANYLTNAPAGTHSIRGRVTNSSGQGIAGVAIRVSGSLTRMTQTDNDGNYVFPNLAAGGHYRLMPVKVHHSFQAVSQSFILLIEDQITNFTGTESAEPALSSLVVSPSLVVGGNLTKGRVTLNGPALSTGTVISMSNTNTAATVPAIVTVPAGATFATFSISTSPVPSITKGSVMTTLEAVSKSAFLQVRPISVKAVELAPNPVAQ